MWRPHLSVSDLLSAQVNCQISMTFGTEVLHKKLSSKHEFCAVTLLLRVNEFLPLISNFLALFHEIWYRSTCHDVQQLFHENQCSERHTLRT
jgi:hypothetical protein